MSQLQLQTPIWGKNLTGSRTRSRTIMSKPKIRHNLMRSKKGSRLQLDEFVCRNVEHKGVDGRVSVPQSSMYYKNTRRGHTLYGKCACGRMVNKPTKFEVVEKYGIPKCTKAQVLPKSKSKSKRKRM